MIKHDIFRGGVEVELPAPEAFLKIKETLTRIGIPSAKEQKLYQSCHILHKQGRYAILHFKELFFLDGREWSVLTEDDRNRRNTIASLLQSWGLLTILDKTLEVEHVQLKIVPFREKANWTLIPKYNIGTYK